MHSFSELAKRKIKSLKKIPDGFTLPSDYVILVAGIARSGKTSFLSTLYNCFNNKSRDFSAFMTSQGKMNHGTIRTGALRLAPNFLVIDTKGIEVPESEVFSTAKEVRELLERENTEVFQTLVNNTSYLKSLSGDSVAYPQLVVLVAKATIFQSQNRDSSSKEIQFMTADVNQQLVLKTWKDTLNSDPKLFNRIRVVLTMAEKCGPVEGVRKAAASQLGLSESQIFLVTNYNPENYDAKDDHVEETFAKITEYLFDIIDATVEPIPVKELVIERATYIKVSNSAYQQDVTRELTRHLGHNSTLHINPRKYNSIFGDPFPWYEKKLKVSYYHLGVRKEIEVAESDGLDLP